MTEYVIEKKCAICGSQFWGDEFDESACESCVETRARKSKAIIPTFRGARAITANITEVGQTTLNCRCCSKPFITETFPGQSVFPEYCSTHRTEHRRKQFMNRGVTA